MLWGWFAWIFFVHGIHNTLSGEPPVIRHFLPHDLIQPGDVPSESGFRLPCKASGTSPLEYRWQHNGRDIKYGEQYQLLMSGALEGIFLDHTNNGTYQCFVKNDFGEDFSRKIKVLVTVAGKFHYANDKVAPVTLGKPIEIQCPSHEPSFGATYLWGGYSAMGDPREFVPLPEDQRIAVTKDGTLLIMFVKRQDVTKVNIMGGIQCEMSLGPEKKYSHSVNFRVQGNEFTESTAPSIYFAPKPQEEAREGYEKELYCLAVAKPEPYIIWRKDGEKIEDGDDGFYLPAKHFNRLLVIKKVTQEHQGNYTCTAYSTSGSSEWTSVASFLTVKASPKWTVELSPNTSAARSETTSLLCRASSVPPPHYRWFRNGREIDASSYRVKLQKNILKLKNVDSWHEAVFQCVAENDLGMSVTSTWVHVEDPPTVGPSTQRGADPEKLLWIIITAVLGVLLIVCVIMVIVCYKRRKARRREERPRATEETSNYNDLQGNPSLSNAASSGIKGAKGMKRRPTLPPVPQYQALDPSTAGVANYEPVDPEQDLNDSGLYEKLDFRSLDNGPQYDNPDKPIPEYLELVNDTNVPPGNTASTVKTEGPGKQYYEPMEGGLRDDVFNNSNSAPKDYVPMEIDEPNVKNTAQSSPSSPKYYEPMAGKLEPSAQTKGSSSSADYYQPMVDKTGPGEQGDHSPPSPEYYVPMAEQSLK